MWKLVQSLASSFALVRAKTQLLSNKFTKSEEIDFQDVYSAAAWYGKKRLPVLVSVILKNVLLLLDTKFCFLMQDSITC